jgi:hypothetical protein
LINGDLIWKREPLFKHHGSQVAWDEGFAMSPLTDTQGRALNCNGSFHIPPLSKQHQPLKEGFHIENRIYLQKLVESII